VIHEGMWETTMPVRSITPDKLVTEERRSYRAVVHDLGIANRRERGRCRLESLDAWIAHPLVLKTERLLKRAGTPCFVLPSMTMTRG